MSRKIPMQHGRMIAEHDCRMPCQRRHLHAQLARTAETHHVLRVVPFVLNVQNASRECEHAVAVRCSTIEEIGLLKTSSVHVGDIL